MFGLDPATISIILTLIELTEKYGIPAVQTLIQNWENPPKVITRQDLLDLCAPLADPESFFQPIPAPEG